MFHVSFQVIAVNLICSIQLRHFLTAVNQFRAVNFEYSTAPSTVIEKNVSIRVRESDSVPLLAELTVHKYFSIPVLAQCKIAYIRFFSMSRKQ